MKKIREKRETKKLGQLVRKYKSQGYEIFANQPGFEKPKRIGDFIPDMMVRKGGQEIIIEVASDQSIQDLEEKLKALSEYASQHDGTKFNLVITNPRRTMSSEEKFVLRKYLLENLQRELLLEVKRQFDKGNFETSFIILCQLVENLLQEIAMMKRIIAPRKKRSSNQLVSILFEKNVLSSDDYSFLRELLGYRNRVVHKLDRVERDRLRDYINFVSSLLNVVR